MSDQKISQSDESTSVGHWETASCLVLIALSYVIMADQYFGTITAREYRVALLAPAVGLAVGWILFQFIQLGVSGGSCTTTQVAVILPTLVYAVVYLVTQLVATQSNVMIVLPEHLAPMQAWLNSWVILTTLSGQIALCGGAVFAISKLKSRGHHSASSPRN